MNEKLLKMIAVDASVKRLKAYDTITRREIKRRVRILNRYKHELESNVSTNQTDENIEKLLEDPLWGM